ncbi:hypothetical protein LJC27_01915 [Christensenellaceae bacterium OttesenSCG-928-M15]|nr:hypothetical protein [Christensenellaceae bacterium OttesenSCG-928-M15]
MDGLLDKIIGVALSAVVAIIGFFLNRAFRNVDENKKAIEDIRTAYAKREELEKVERSSGAALVKMEQRMNERLDQIDSKIENIRAECVTEATFVREIKNLQDQNTRVIEMLFEMRQKG